MSATGQGHSTASRDTGPFVFAATLDVWVQLLVSAHGNHNNKYIPPPYSAATQSTDIIMSTSTHTAGSGMLDSPQTCAGLPEKLKSGGFKLA